MTTTLGWREGQHAAGMADMRDDAAHSDAFAALAASGLCLHCVVATVTQWERVWTVSALCGRHGNAVGA